MPKLRIFIELAELPFSGLPVAGGIRVSGGGRTETGSRTHGVASAINALKVLDEFNAALMSDIKITDKNGRSFAREKLEKLASAEAENRNQ